MDYLILQLAVTEAELFLDSPTRVILNEYLNLAHLFSSEQSHVFINGILHPLCMTCERENLRVNLEL